MRISELITIGGVCLLIGVPVTAQTRADLSGTWEWQGAEGVSRDGVKGPVRVLEVSGGAFNCGRLCTIVQSSRAITISRPADEKGPKHQDVVLTFTGPSGDVHAQWDRDKLLVTNSVGMITTKQTIARQGNKLIVTSLVAAPGVDASPVVQTYIKK